MWKFAQVVLKSSQITLSPQSKYFILRNKIFRHNFGFHKTIFHLRSYGTTVDSTNIQLLFTGIKQGDRDIVKSFVEGGELSKRDERGYWPLMVAAEHGQVGIVRQLLEARCEPNLRSWQGNTARELAHFYNHPETAQVLNDTPSFTLARNYFSAAQGLHRKASKRDQKEWLEDLMQSPSAQFVILYKAVPLVVPSSLSGHSHKGRAKHSLYYAKFTEIQQHIQSDCMNVVFLGTTSESENEVGYFALDVSELQKTELSQFGQEVTLMNLMPSMMQLSAWESGLCSQARSLCDWHLRYGYCPTCGAPSKATSAGNKRVCSDASCQSNKGIHNTSYPRIDPTAITSVISPDNTQCLLARKSMFPYGMYSTLAGFVEPGESVEDAVCREVEEEVGLTVDEVSYHSSQPWPMPAVLMLGCRARTSATHPLKVDTEELETACWFSRGEIVAMVTGTHQEGCFMPPPQAIATQITKSWLMETAFARL